MLSVSQKEKSLHCSTSVVKKARRSTSSQLTLKSFFMQTKGPSSIGIMDIETSQTRADSGKGNENIFHETKSSCAGDLVGNIEEDRSESNVHERSTGGQDPRNMNICSSLKEKGNAAVLEWQKIQEKMKTTIPLCKGHREPCVARSVKKGPNIGRRFYVCARPKVLDLSLFYDILIYFMLFAAHYLPSFIYGPNIKEDY